MEDVPLEGEVHQLVTSMGLRKWKKRYMIVKHSNLFFYEKQEEVNNPNHLLKVSFYEVKEVTEATFIGDQASQLKRDAHNCGFKIDYGGHHSLSLQANSHEERGRFVKCLQEKKIYWQTQSTPTENKVFFDKKTASVEMLETSVDPKDPLGLVGKEEVVQMRDSFEGTCSVRLLYSDGSTQNTTLSSNMTGNDVLEQVQDLSSSSGSSLWLLDTKGVVQNLKPYDKPGPKLARLYGLCVVEPQNRVFVVHLPSGDWLPLILNKGVNCQQIIESKQIKTKISDNQIANPALFIRKSTELQVASSHTVGDIQLPHQECPGELIYTQTPHGVEHKETMLIIKPGGAGSAVSKTERNRTMTMKDKYALLSSPLSKAKNQRNFEMIYDEAIENLESDPLQSSVFVPKFEQRSEDSYEATDLPDETVSDNIVEESSLMESSVEQLPSSEPRGRLAPLHNTSPSKSEGVKKLINKTFHSKRSSVEIQKEDDPVQRSSERRRGRATALSLLKDDDHMAYVDEAIKHNPNESHPFEMSFEEHATGPPKPHYKPPLQQSRIIEESKTHLVRPSSLAPILSASEIARHVTSAKTPDEEINPMSPTSITLQEIAKYPTIKNSPWQLMENNSPTPQSQVLDRNAILSNLQARANPKMEGKPTIGATKADERQPIIIPKATVAPKTNETRAFQIISPALLRTWVLNKASNPPPKIQVNRSILEWKNSKWVLAPDSQYSEVNTTGEENKSIFKLPGEIELVFYDRSKSWSVTGPKIFKPKPTSTEWKKKNGGSSVKTNVVFKKIEFTRQAIAEYANTVNNDDELGFDEGDVMFIVSEVGEDWLICENKEGRKGYVPKNYVTIKDYKPPTPPPSPVTEEEGVTTKPENQSEETKKGEGEVKEKIAELADEVEVQQPEPVIDLPTKLAKLLREKLHSLQNAVDPIIWHSGATRDPEMKKQLFDDRKTPAVAVLIRGNLTSSLAEIILRGMKSKSSFFQIENNNIWSLVLETVKYRESIPACASAYRAVEDICILSEVTNTLGSSSAKFRSFVCQALNNQFLEPWLYTVFFDLGGVALESIYDVDSFVVHSRHAKIQPLLKEMLLSVQPLDALGFQLSINFERDPRESESKWFWKGGVGKKFGDLFMKTMTLPITPIPPKKNSSRAASRENLSDNPTMSNLSVPSSPNANGEKRFVITPGESVTKGNVTVDTATEVAIADPAYRTIGPKKSIEQLSKIVDGDSKIPEETLEEMKI